jgi:hypothetical protein
MSQEASFEENKEIGENQVSAELGNLNPDLVRNLEGFDLKKSDSAKKPEIKRSEEREIQLEKQLDALYQEIEEQKKNSALTVDRIASLEHEKRLFLKIPFELDFFEELLSSKLQLKDKDLETQIKGAIKMENPLLKILDVVLKIWSTSKEYKESFQKMTENGYQIFSEKQLEEIKSLLKNHIETEIQKSAETQLSTMKQHVEMLKVQLSQQIRSDVESQLEMKLYASKQAKPFNLLNNSMELELNSAEKPAPTLQKPKAMEVGLFSKENDKESSEEEIRSNKEVKSKKKI